MISLSSNVNDPFIEYYGIITLLLSLIQSVTGFNVINTGVAILAHVQYRWKRVIRARRYAVFRIDVVFVSPVVYSNLKYHVGT